MSDPVFNTLSHAPLTKDQCAIFAHVIKNRLQKEELELYAMEKRMIAELESIRKLIEQTRALIKESDFALERMK